jgi:pyrroline-5-carboxylate reductase
MSDSRLAIQGAGHLTAALVQGFSRAQIKPISLYNRTRQRATDLAREFPIIRVFEEQSAFDSERCPLLLVIPGRALMEESPARMSRLRASGRVVVSCVNGLPLSVLERRFPGIRWIKAIPGITAAVGRSVTLMARGAAVNDAELRSVEEVFASLGREFRPRSDEELDRLSVVTSCLPGILGAILDEFAQVYELDERQIRELLVESAAGFLALAQRDAPTLGELVSQVSNPGGLTEVGVSTIRRSQPSVLAELRGVLDRKRLLRWRQFLTMN